MALYWPDCKVALQIDDDPLAEPFEGPGDWTVIHTDMATMGDFDAFDALMNRLAEMLGEQVDQSNRENRRHLFEELRDASNDLQPEDHLIVDLHSGDVTPWEGETPAGSFCMLCDGTTMSTPEFYYLREAGRRTLAQEMQLAYELCGFYGTDHQDERRGYAVYDESASSIETLRAYLGGARSMDGYRKAMRALDYVVEGSTSPVASYIAILLTSPRHMGGYDLYRPQMDLRLASPLTLERAPTEDGRYESYDLCWPRQRVVVQFVGEEQPSPRERRALEAPGVADMFVICVTLRQLADAEAFEEAARLLAEKLGTPLPPTDRTFEKARDSLRNDLVFPHYDHMRSMAEDWHWHEVA